MKMMQIFEPAMCCSTGLCGVGVDPELLRISTVLNTLKKKEIVVERYNLSNAPRKFVANKAINSLIHEKGVHKLPATVIDGAVVLTGRYPTNDEIIEMLSLSTDIFGDTQNGDDSGVSTQESGCSDKDCCSDSDCCSDGNCCSDNDCCADSDCCSDGDCCSESNSSSESYSSSESSCCSESDCCSGGDCC
ncbi:MAG: arsD [Lachnospiraceae bacterium]|nr:arsD [Lachnospiraceae bacterium]